MLWGMRRRRYSSVRCSVRFSSLSLDYEGAIIRAVEDGEGRIHLERGVSDS